MSWYLAPLHGVTNRIFRNVWFTHFSGLDRAITPFIPAAAASRSATKHYRDIDPAVQGGVPVEPQLLAGPRDAIRECVNSITSLGYTEINLNMGCPYPMVVKKGRGSGLLPDPVAVRRVLDSLCSIDSFRLSAKIRLGYHRVEELDAFIPVLNEYPLSRVTIHPRIGKQMYRGSVDLEGFERAAALCTHEVVYNGDIFVHTQFSGLRAQFPAVQSWMIGRGALMDPFLPEELQTGTRPSDERERLRAYHDELFGVYKQTLYGPRHLLDKMKEIWSYLGYSFGYGGAPRGRAAPPEILRAKTPDQYRIAVDFLFESTPLRSDSPSGRSPHTENNR